MGIVKSVTLTGLYPYSTYRVYVRAMNDVGTGTELSADGTTSSAGMYGNKIIKVSKTFKGVLHP